MADDIIRRVAARLFQQYSRILDITAKNNPQAQAPKDFKRDFFSEVQKAGREMAIRRTEEIRQQIDTLTKRISETEISGDKLLSEILKQERDRLSAKLRID